MITSPACAVESIAKKLDEAGIGGEEALEYKLIDRIIERMDA